MDEMLTLTQSTANQDNAIDKYVDANDTHNMPWDGCFSDENPADPAPVCVDTSLDPNDTALEPDVGDRIEVFWPLDHTFYPGVVAEEQNNNKTIVYGDGGIETLKVSYETWRFASSATLCAQSVSLVSLKSEIHSVLTKMLEHFGNRSFLRYQAQGFPQFCLRIANNVEENDFKKTVRTVRLPNVAPNANIISRHVLYKVKWNDDLSEKLKARTAPHGNEDCAKQILRSDCSMCPPAGFRLVTSVASIKKWRLTLIDVKTAFFQTGSAGREVCVVTPMEGQERGKCLWLLLTAAYGLVNSNAKCK